MTQRDTHEHEYTNYFHTSPKKLHQPTFLPSEKTLTKNILLVFSFSTGFLFCKERKSVMTTSKICILRIEGTNCELETSLAFKRLGASAEIVHLKQLIGAVKERERRNLKDFDLLVIPGGFSSGDYVRAGAILAARIKGALGKQIEDFIEKGNPILGICNGFQVLVEMGLLPGFAHERAEIQQVALTTNDSARFECRPTLIKHESKGKCVHKRGRKRQHPEDALRTCRREVFHC